MTEVNRQWTVAARPDGEAQPRDFGYVESPLLTPGDGEFLVRTQYLSLAPVMLMYMSGKSAAGEKPLAIGDVIHGRGVGRVIASRHPDYAVDDIVHGQIGWQTHKLTRATPSERFFKYQSKDLPTYLALSALGMTGFSAFCGLVNCGQPQPGEAVLISGAAGGVGHMVVQLARALGCTPVVGIAGGKEKCALIKELGCDIAIDYKSADVEGAIANAFPQGVDVYFDNVGGPTLSAALNNLAFGARVVLCGSISEYTLKEPFGPTNYTELRAKEAVMRGFFVYNHHDSFERAERAMARFIRDGKLNPQQTIIDGFENMPSALMGLYQGANRGKQIVAVNPNG